MGTSWRSSISAELPLLPSPLGTAGFVHTLLAQSLDPPPGPPVGASNGDESACHQDGEDRAGLPSDAAAEADWLPLRDMDVRHMELFRTNDRPMEAFWPMASFRLMKMGSSNTGQLGGRPDGELVTIRHDATTTTDDMSANCGAWVVCAESCSCRNGIGAMMVSTEGSRCAAVRSKSSTKRNCGNPPADEEVCTGNRPATIVCVPLRLPLVGRKSCCRGARDDPWQLPRLLPVAAATAAARSVAATAINAW